MNNWEIEADKISSNSCETINLNVTYKATFNSIEILSSIPSLYVKSFFVTNYIDTPTIRTNYIEIGGKSFDPEMYVKRDEYHDLLERVKNLENELKLLKT